MHKSKEIWWLKHYEGLGGSCLACGNDGPVMSDRTLTEMFQKNLIKPEDLSRMNDPSFPEDKKRLLMSVLGR